MTRIKLAAVAMAAMALFAGPLATAPAHASTHPCDSLFAEPYGYPCRVAIGVYCLIFPTQAICH